VLESLARLPVDAGDPLVTPIAVDLALRGIARESDLSADARTELAARRGDAMTQENERQEGVDARHRLLALALSTPSDRERRTFAATLGTLAPSDAIVAVALARMAATDGSSLPSEVTSHLEIAASSDPLAAAALVVLCDRRGDAVAAVRARGLLAGLAVTDVERALARGLPEPKVATLREVRSD
jgi:hypothetical protein